MLMNNINSEDFIQYYKMPKPQNGSIAMVIRCQFAIVI